MGKDGAHSSAVEKIFSWPNAGVMNLLVSRMVREDVWRLYYSRDGLFLLNYMYSC